MDSRYRIIVSNRNKNIYKEIELPAEATRLTLGTGVSCDVRLHKSLFFEPVELVFTKDGGQWHLSCADNLYLQEGDVKKLVSHALEHGDMETVKYQSSDAEVFTVDFLIDFASGSIRYERQIDLSSAGMFTIGSAVNANIAVNSPYVQGDVIRASRQGTSLLLEVTRSRYGVYHNGNRIDKSAEIKDGDFFSVSDFFFYLTGGVLLTQIRGDMRINGLRYTDTPIPYTYPKFNRSTRLKQSVCQDPIEVLDPPQKPQEPKNNLFIRLLPSVGMIVACGVMAFFGRSMILFSIISGGIGVLTSILTIRESKKDYEKNLQDRVEKYTAYIARKREEIETERRSEKQTMEELYVSQEEEEQRFDGFSPLLFDRTPRDEDFLCVRLGDGDVEAKREIKLRKQEQLEVEDDLQQMPEQIREQYRYIQSAPVVCDLKSVNAVGVTGSEAFRLDMLKNIVIDIAARQYYTDVRMVFVAEAKNAGQVSWLRLLPHVYDESTGVRTLVVDDDSKTLVFEYLYKELSARAQTKEHPSNIVLFFYDECGFKTHPISRFVDRARDLDVTFVFFGQERTDIPMGCGYLIAQQGEGGQLIKTDDKDAAVSFVYPHISTAEAEKIVDLLAPVYSEAISLEGSLTKSISLFEMLNILAVDDLDLQKRWGMSQVYSTMAAPIGVTTKGTITLDLHDKADGPHGLVAGTTGSGKSELLQTYILSMSTLFHPYEVGFVIIDFKGGGMVNQFRDLPHLLGAITNIDGKEIDRSLKSIRAELEKRQRLFAEADVNHIDKYIRKYRAGEVSTPLPHLILIVDEFAELKAQQPEFMKELISTARIGRSLGVHLILATQKPAGQVNEQIWSNSNFRLCLKVATPQDSNEVLKSPLAAEIKEPGRAYLQVGNEEKFELFQSAFSGAPERNENNLQKEFSISSISMCGKRTQVYARKGHVQGEDNRTQLDALVQYIGNYCISIGLERLANICLPPLEDVLSLPADLPDYPMHRLPLGIYDDPGSQYQGYAEFDLCGNNSLIVGAALTGKTNLIQNIIRLVAARFSPGEAVFYIADFGSMYLKNFEGLNHVGGVVTISESEKLKNLFKLLSEEVEARKTRFLACGLSSYLSYKEAGYDDLPHIFFIIDNFGAFRETYMDDYEDQLINLTREGITYGISVIVTSTGTSSVGYKYMSNFANRIAFSCNDPSEYMNVIDRCRMQPKDVPGRMLSKLSNGLFEIQSFLAFEGEKEFERSAQIKRFVESVNSRWPEDRARLIPSVPEKLTYDYIDANFDVRTKRIGQYPIALDYGNVELVYLDLRTTSEFCIVGRSQEKNLAAAKSILSAVHHYALEMPVRLYVIDSVERPLRDVASIAYVEKYTIDYNEIETVFEDVEPLLERRYSLLVDGDTEALAKQEQIIVLINNRDAIEYISGSKIFAIYTKMIKQFKALGISFLFSDVEDAAAYGAPDLLRRLRDMKKAIITSSLQDFKFCDLPPGAARQFKTVNRGDCFLINGSELTRIKLAEEDKI